MKKVKGSRKTPKSEKHIRVNRSFAPSTLENLKLLVAHYGLPSESSLISMLVVKELRLLIKAGQIEPSTLPTPLPSRTH